ncbi:hypothetical protein SRABI05_03060 [Agrobacterium fabrum]|jgi:ATP-dependent DNA ligase|nr:hypothetical protein At12D13_38160 [Agrobacterium fabrum]CAH0253874.1 hypothetical protein SRABI46_03296 [Agrobacterium fabrum]CAH0254016.1 hypothetical protein SRABI05_03060 [Agrobacterium fabrum]
MTGRPDFGCFRSGKAAGNRASDVLYAFDLLYLDGHEPSKLTPMSCLNMLAALAR